MEINYEYHKVTASKRLEKFIEEKLDKLFKKYSFIIRADVFLKQKTKLPKKQE
ncbi:MAG: HPF/RaiA family ribosome-associated protein [Polaribacter sp.]